MFTAITFSQLDMSAAFIMPSRVLLHQHITVSYLSKIYAYFFFSFLHIGISVISKCLV